MRCFAFASAAALTALAVAGPACAQVPAPDFVVDMPLATRAGRLSLYLPADLRAGDTISGTVLAEPVGRNEAARQRNLAELNGYVIEVEGTRVRRAGNAVSFAVPAAGALSLVVLSADGRRRLTRTRIEAGPAVAVQPVDPPPTMQLPALGQQGRPIEIAGPFDGSFDNTSVRIGGETAHVIAESPRSLVVQVPEGAPGPTAVEISESGVVSHSTFNRVAIRLSVPRTNLRRGERTMVSVMVEGLPPPAAPTEMVALTLTGSRTITLDQGNVQTVMLRPDAQGQATFQRGVAATAPGPFSIRASLNARRPAQPGAGTSER